MLLRLSNRALAKSSVEYDRAIGGVLRQLPLRAPVDEDVIIWKRLERSLRLGQDALLGRNESLDKRCRLLLMVDGDVLAPRVRVNSHLSAASGFRPIDGVVEQGDDLDGFVATRKISGMMLEAKLDLWTKIEVGVAAAESPDDGAISSIDAEDGGGVASREEIVSVIALGDRVDMEVIPGRGAIMPNSSLAKRKGEGGF